jgi:hypothetical protein
MSAEMPRAGPSPALDRKSEDTSDGCRARAKDDRDRAQASDSDRMRFRLACSAEAWTARADLLDRLEANRAQLESGVLTKGPRHNGETGPTGTGQ